MAKSKRKESVHLNNFFVGCKTGYECAATLNNIDHLADNKAKFKYWNSNVYFKIIDVIIVGMNKRFSLESLIIGVGVDNCINLKYEESLEFVNKYEVPLYLYLFNV